MLVLTNQNKQIFQENKLLNQNYKNQKHQINEIYNKEIIELNRYYRYYKSDKKQLILKLWKRIEKEKLLYLPQDLLNYITTFIPLTDKSTLKSVCKTCKFRINLKEYEHIIKTSKKLFNKYYEIL